MLLNKALLELKNFYGEQFCNIFRTITADNGSEFSRLTEILQPLGIEVYYAHILNSPWEKVTLMNVIMVLYGVVLYL